MSSQGTTSRRKSHWLIESLVVIVVALVIAALVRAFIAQAFFIPSGSMEQTLLEDDWILVSKVGLWWGDVERGEVVVFKDPGGWLDDAEPASTNPVRRGLEFIGVAPSSSEGDLVKRVIGVGGDHVECCDEQGRLIINGIPVDEPTLDSTDEPGDAPSGCNRRFEISVPIGYLWVMGDHRSVSEDSRCHEGLNAFVSEDDVIGKAVMIFLPVGRWDLIDSPDVYRDLDPQ